MARSLMAFPSKMCVKEHDFRPPIVPPGRCARKSGRPAILLDNPPARSIMESHSTASKGNYFRRLAATRLKRDRPAKVRATRRSHVYSRAMSKMRICHGAAHRPDGAVELSGVRPATQLSALRVDAAGCGRRDGQVGMHLLPPGFCGGGDGALARWRNTRDCATG